MTRILVEDRRPLPVFVPFLRTTDPLPAKMAKSKTKSRAVEQVSSSSSVSMPPSKPPKPSASSSSSQDLAALEAHFLATFGEGSLPAAGPSRIKEQEKFESEEEDGQRVADVSHSEGGKVKKQSPKAGVKAKAVGPSPSSATPRQPPQTVVFEEMGGRGRSQPEDEGMASDSRKKWRDFMVSSGLHPQCNRAGC